MCPLLFSDICCFKAPLWKDEKTLTPRRNQLLSVHLDGQVGESSVIICTGIQKVFNEKFAMKQIISIATTDRKFFILSLVNIHPDDTPTLSIRSNLKIDK